MEKQALLDKLNTLIGRYQQHRHYIDKARAQAATGKFNNTVIEKVVLDHEIKASSVADELVPLLPDLVESIASLEAERNVIQSSKGSLDEQVQELDLRLLIGELTEDEYNAEIAGLKTHQDSAGTRIEAIEAELGVYNRILSSWEQLSGQTVSRTISSAPEQAGSDTVALVEEPKTGEGSQTSESQTANTQADPAPVEPALADSANAPQAIIEEPMGAHISVSKIQEDIGPMISDGSAQVNLNKAVEEDIAIETADVEANDLNSSQDIEFSLNEGSVSVEASVSGEVEIDFGVESAPVQPDAPAGQRRGMLLYQEGTPEEQIYPFQNEQLTIGRGRENDIQIKNDSKVSRYHCRITRRGTNFYIEDVKSSNGTLVNGELVTERRLFGGEEVVIGETTFRFIIMD
jgi:hypothetical protein